MSILKGLVSRRSDASRRKAIAQQTRVLRKLLFKAQNTAFGDQYDFQNILIADDLMESFRQKVPVHSYDSMRHWWERSRGGEKSVCWPGKVNYFALSSGTSDGASKYIPVTSDMLRAIKRSSMRQVLSVARSGLPGDSITKHSLMIGGSTELEYNGRYYSGDLSGITTGNIPFWFQPFSKPEKTIRAKKNWQEKIDEITQKAKDWNVSMVAGVPAWVQLLFENIISHYKLNTIHDIWPNLKVYIHGGVSFDPYRKSFESLLGQPIHYFETYLASEGFIAYQTHSDASGMKLILRNGIYYEFVPFNRNNFNEEGELVANPEVLNIKEVKAGQEYAILITTCSGAWRYLIGDVIKFANLEKHEIRITGRTKHFLSLCGEHLSVDNMNMAVKKLSDEYDSCFNEFTVSGISHQGLFAHHWFLSCDKELDREKVKLRLDELLKELNDDYKVERSSALKDIFVDLVPNDCFIKWLRSQGKEGAQTKFPRVLKKAQYDDWTAFIKKEAVPVENIL